MEEVELGTRVVGIERHSDGVLSRCEDMVAAEEPLEIRLDGHPIAVLMRTPGDDTDLVVGFLRTEGILVGSESCRKIVEEGNRALVFLNEGVEVDLGRLARNMFAGSSCGICGKATMEAVFTEFPAIRERWCPSDEAFMAAPGKLLESQKGFSETGGLHAAALFDDNGKLVCMREDVGRHNAVDKVIGAMLRKDELPTRCWLLVSGRVSFEIVQKVLAAGIPCLAGISAPSSLAVGMAKESGITLVGFLRPPSFNRYG